MTPFAYFGFSLISFCIALLFFQQKNGHLSQRRGIVLDDLKIELFDRFEQT